MADILEQSKAQQKEVAIEKIPGSDGLPKDARSVFQHLLSNGGSGNGVTAVNNAKEIITLNNLNMVGCMPPMGDNIIDPPPFLAVGHNKDKIVGVGRSYPNAFSTGLCGMDYIERNLVSGSFLILVPLEMKPSVLKQVEDKFKSLKYEELTSLQGRLGVADYGLEASVSTRRYWRTYTMMLKATSMALGLDLDSGAYSEQALKNSLPEHIWSNIINKDPSSKMFSMIDGETSSKKQKSTGKRVEAVDKGMVNAIKEATGLSKGDKAKTPVEPEGSITPSENVTAENIDAIISGTSYINLLKYMTNVDDSAIQNTRLPIISFYINGVVERSYATQSNIEESKTAKASTDILRRALGKTIGGSAEVQEVVDYAEEFAYHGAVPPGASFALSNTSIPKIISDTATDFSYNVKLTSKAVGSDAASLLRVINPLAQLMPFVTPVSDGKQNTVVPNAPLYCSAFVKGIMNVPRGAITSMQITTNPQFQTSEGIPTEMDIVLTIQPLLTISTVPNFGSYFTRTDNPSLVASMFNPMSAFNVLATMCGYNSILTKYPYSLFEYFVGGKIESFYSSIKGTGNYISTALNDFVASPSLAFGTKIIPKW